ncbi:MAG: DUF6036 family nucleotidyltransferase [Pseudomonadota bacterium]
MLSNNMISKAFIRLDVILDEKVNLLIGGGAALLILDIMPISTMDVDAIPFKSIIGPEDLKKYSQAVAKELDLPADWLNEYFYQFTHCLPDDYGDRLKEVFSGEKLTCFCLSPTDIAIMKFFAHRGKDQSHLRYLIKNKHLDLDFIDNYLDEMVEKNHPGAEDALACFHDLLEALGI